MFACRKRRLDAIRQYRELRAQVAAVDRGERDIERLLDAAHGMERVRCINSLWQVQTLRALTGMDGRLAEMRRNLLTSRNRFRKNSRA